MKQYNKKNTSFLSHKAYYIALAVGFAVLIALMVIYSKQMKNKNQIARQEINLDEVGNEAIQKTEVTESTTQEITTTEATETKPTQAKVAPTLSYDGKTKLDWPINGNILLPFSMDTTVYFETLDQYKCNPGILIEAKEGQGVGAVTKCQVIDVMKSDELGNQVVLDLGDGYTVILGQLKDVKVKKGDVLKTGDIIASVAKPTNYYTLEGEHLYMEMLHKEKPVNPVDYMKE
ncbi:MAG: M23 family metallopeptidase [Lachnospiraceae bacterium]|nr:M23 family metallopeptidase [Lachnospiraceae bacterium]